MFEQEFDKLGWLRIYNGKCKMDDNQCWQQGQFDHFKRSVFKIYEK